MREGVRRRYLHIEVPVILVDFEALKIIFNQGGYRLFAYERPVYNNYQLCATPIKTKRAAGRTGGFSPSVCLAALKAHPYIRTINIT